MCKGVCVEGVKEGGPCLPLCPPTDVFGSVDDTDILPKCGHTASLEHLHDSQGRGWYERRLP